MLYFVIDTPTGYLDSPTILIKLIFGIIDSYSNLSQTSEVKKRLDESAISEGDKLEVFNILNEGKAESNVATVGKKKNGLISVLMR